MRQPCQRHEQHGIDQQHGIDMLRLRGAGWVAGLPVYGSAVAPPMPARPHVQDRIPSCRLPSLRNAIQQCQVNGDSTLSQQRRALHRRVDRFLGILYAGYGGIHRLSWPQRRRRHTEYVNPRFRDLLPSHLHILYSRCNRCKSPLPVQEAGCRALGGHCWHTARGTRQCHLFYASSRQPVCMASPPRA